MLFPVHNYCEQDIAISRPIFLLPSISKNIQVFRLQSNSIIWVITVLSFKIMPNS